jgi:hypothetical protein
MDLFNELGDALRLEPKDWPVFAPPYYSAEGWEFEKRQTAQKILFQIKDTNAINLINHAGNMAEGCAEAGDINAACKYNRIALRLLNYRLNLICRYPLGV